jgi:hypothetical protein
LVQSVTLLNVIVLNGILAEGEYFEDH